MCLRGGDVVNVQHVVMILDDEVLLPLVNTPKEKHQRGKKRVEEVDFLTQSGVFCTSLSHNLKKPTDYFHFPMSYLYFIDKK